MLHFDPKMIGHRVSWKHREHDDMRTGLLMGAFIADNHYLHFIVRDDDNGNFSQQIIIICVTTYFKVEIDRS